MSLEERIPFPDKAYPHLGTRLPVNHPIRLPLLIALALIIGCGGGANRGRMIDVQRTESIEQSSFEICLSRNSLSITREEAAALIASELTTGAADGLSSDFRVLDQEISQLRGRIEQWRNDADSSLGAAFESADQYWELAKIYGDLAVRYDVLSHCERPPDISPSGFRCSPRVAESMAGKSWEKHIKTLLKIRDDYREFAHYDEILFTLGFRIETLGWRKDPEKRKAYVERARVFYMELVENHRGSRFIPLAWFLFAEYFLFDAGDFDRALRGYEMAAGTNNPLLSVILERKALLACVFATRP